MANNKKHIFFSVIIPVYNRPDEIDELLESLTLQVYTHFEVIIIEDGSENPCRTVAESYQDELELHYHAKENSGQGFSRNFGFQKAQGDYFVVFDSDCLIPPHYFQTVNERLQNQWLDAYGGPDKAHDSFTPLQKAISYAMTSPLTTGGIRGNEKHSGQFHPRSFNMGLSREVFEATGGFRITRKGEDIEFSIRIIEHEFSTGLIPEAYVYHKRRTSLREFYHQLHFFGQARINIGRFHPDEIKWLHALPAVFVIVFFIWLSALVWAPAMFLWAGILGLIILLALGTHAAIKTKDIGVGILSMATSFIQLFAYGIGFLSEWAAPEKQNKD